MSWHAVVAPFQRRRPGELSVGVPQGPTQHGKPPRRVEVEVKVGTRTESGRLSVLTFKQTDLTPLVMDPVLHDDSFMETDSRTIPCICL